VNLDLLESSIKEDKPFSLDYYYKELDSFKVRETNYKNLQIKLKSVDTKKVVCYMHEGFMELKEFPVLYINKEIWMSLTPMEVQSHYMPILMAHGEVGVGGLGMGYYVQRILKKENVDKVKVFELNKDVIDLYVRNFGEHEKLEIINKDVMEVEGEYFDFFYNDIYPNMLDSNVISDMAHIMKRNEIDLYHFWTQEMVVLEAINDGHIDKLPINWRFIYSPFLTELLDVKEDYIIVMNFGDQFIRELSREGIIE